MSESLFPAETTRTPRVVSTSPSGTEICYALGVEPVAVSHSCDYPPAVADRPVIDRSRVEGDGSAERHESVGAAEQSGGVYEIDEALLAELEPDLVLSQSVCGVCAVDETLVREVLDDDSVEVLGLSASTFDDVLASVRQVGEATGREQRAEELVDDCLRRVADVRRAAPDAGPRVAVVEWMDPLRVAGNWIPDLVTAAGGEYGLVASGDRSADVEWDDVREYAPEVVVVAPCSYGVAETRERLDELADRPGWESLPAVRTDRVHVVDGAVLNRWTPRLVEALDDFAAMFHPDGA
ncbi:iron complex transport system substrate-binding protein [Halopelagius inordinatus]|uniref:Iron complex transport system substrate-binding protein n=1 Tax=Halopelagius inordinatus TaxID=553467 RepID=A0A1I2VEA3_9EURY|nr:ABC transporter substrate-binding protein [Halopelagius inordinatus]SFG87675.1 iron complex transport system substrate-binding protein [Halopelagius inordinatus]